ncbi:MAG: hypothetical protein ACXW3Z_09680 [Limisphaerales bacterium]
MIKGASFVVIALFWVVMNGLLWRSEFGTGNVGASVPARLVWEKILTAPDDSSLSINRLGKKLGYLRIRPRLNEPEGTALIASENEPEGIVRKLSEYNLQIDGSLLLESIGRSARFDGDFAFAPDLAWKRSRAEAFIRPNRWEIKGSAEDQDFWFQSSDGESEWIHRYTIDDLRNPQRILAQVDSPLVAALLPQFLSAAASTHSSRTANSPLSFALHWDARFEWLSIGRNRVRIYRLEAKLLDRHRIVVLVSRVGEILRIELPGEFKLINDVLYAS